VEAARLETTEDEAAYVADWVARRWRSPSGRRTNLSAAVLCRKRAQFPLVVEALKARDLPVEVVGLGGLLLTPEVNDLVSLLWVVQDPSRGDRLMRLLTGPFCRLGPADLDGLASWARAQQRATMALPGEAQVLQLPGLETAPDEDFEEPGEFDPASRGSDESGLVRHPAVGEVRDQAPESSDRASIVEALDDLPPAAWRGAGRPAGLGRGPRPAPRARPGGQGPPPAHRPAAGRAGRRGERALGLDIEVLARPEHTVATARAHLDAFAEVAATFSASADRPNLGGSCLARRGDRAGARPRRADHRDVARRGPGADGARREGPGVGLRRGARTGGGVVPGPRGRRRQLVEGRPLGGLRAQGQGLVRRGRRRPLRPARRRRRTATLHWRDAPDWEAMSKDFAEYALEGGRHATAEERRLAYVALTRARSELLLRRRCGPTPATPKVTSLFLESFSTPLIWSRSVGGHAGPDAAGAPTIPGSSNRFATRGRTTPCGSPEQLAGGVALVAAALASPSSAAPLDAATAAELDLLLAERAEAAAPTRWSSRCRATCPRPTSVQLATDQTRFALSLRRPMPPLRRSRPGAAPPSTPGSSSTTTARRWSTSSTCRAAPTRPPRRDHRRRAGPDERAVPRQRVGRPGPRGGRDRGRDGLDGFAIRGRIDAVFPPDGGGFTIVDWKTGIEPDASVRRHRTLQLAAYALAYARLRNLPPRDVDAAFYYAATGTTVRPTLPREKALRSLLATVPD
jgi:DNA helicase-2/ATP-dependent DNA helicase PcrA